MKKLLSSLQALCGFIIFGLIGGVDCGEPLRQALVLICICGISMIMLQMAKKFCLRLPKRKADSKVNNTLYYKRCALKSQGGAV